MKIGLISDTHIPESMPELPAQVRTVFAGADLI
jgi:predicted phosphodiesterase